MGGSGEQTAPDSEAEFSKQLLGIAAFISHLSRIAPNPDREINGASHLIDDLEFDAVAFSRLGVLVYERYGIGGIGAALLRSENLTVEGFFEHCILRNPGTDPGARPSPVPPA